MNIKKHIPNAITLMNQFSGIIALIFAYKGDFDFALLFVLIGAGFDFLDGMVARLLKVTSPMGKELDSLADMITFGLVPGMVAYKLLIPLGEVWYYLPFAGFVITLFSALRLAKFNIDTRQTTSFIGLATPANAIFWLGASYAYRPLIESFSPWILLLMVLVFSYLLVCEMPMFSLKFHNFAWRDNAVRYIFIMGIIVLAALLRVKALPVIILWYIALSVADDLVNLRKNSENKK